MPRCPGFLLLGTMQLHLIPDWQHAWRWSSVRLIAVGAAVQGTLVAMPASVSQYVPQWAMQGLALFSLGCMLAAALGRITTTEPPK